jgi:hypothetical protein
LLRETTFQAPFDLRRVVSYNPFDENNGYTNDPDGSEFGGAGTGEDMYSFTGSCSAEFQGSEFVMYPPPAILDLSPPAICVGKVHEVLVQGDGFLTVDGVRPQISLVKEGTLEQTVHQDDVEMLNCIDGVSAHHHVEVCTTLKVQVRAGSLTVGQFDIHVANPEPVRGTDLRTFSGRIDIVAAPRVNSVDASLVCVADGPQAVAVTGQGFVSVAPADGSAVTEFSVIKIDGVSAEFVDAEDCVASVVTNQLSEYIVSTCTKYVIRLQPELDSPEARFPEISLVQPPSVGGDTTTSSTLIIHPAPISHDITWPVICDDVLELQPISIDGEKFLIVDGQTPTVTLQPGGTAVAIENVVAGSCITVPNVPRLNVQVCKTLTIMLSAAFLSELTSVDVQNPTLAAGCTAKESVYFRTVSRATLASAAPRIGCNVDADLSITLEGGSFFSLDNLGVAAYANGIAVDVTSLTGCDDLQLPGLHTLKQCSTLKITIPQDPGRTSVEVPTIVVEMKRQGAACDTPCRACQSKTSEALIGLLPKPKFGTFFPAVCGFEDSQSFSISGANFISAAGFGAPVFTVGGSSRAIESLSSCTNTGTALGFPADDDVRICNVAVLQLTEVTATNPETFTTNLPISVANQGGCAVESNQVVVKDQRKPLVDSFDPPTLCSTLDGQTLTIGGSFPIVAGTNSIVFLSGKYAPEESSECTATSCSKIVVNTPDGIEFGRVSIDLKAACVADETKYVNVINTPVADSTNPSVVCETQGKVVEITGEYIQPDATLTLDSVSWDVNSITACETVRDVDVCKKMEFTVAPYDLDPGFVLIGLSNGNAKCDGEADDILEIIKEPVISAITATLCFDTAGEVAIEGQYFRAGATRVWLIQADVDGIPLEYQADSVESVTNSKIVVKYSPKRVLAGLYTVRIENGPDCRTTTTLESEVTLRVHPQLFAFFVDPTIVYSKTAIGIAVYASGLLDQAETLVFEHGSENNTVVYSTGNMSFVTTGGEAEYNKIRATSVVGMEAG